MSPRKSSAAEREARRRRELDEHIARVVAAAPPLTPEQRDRIAVLLRPVKGPS